LNGGGNDHRFRLLKNAAVAQLVERRIVDP
jgi:hypothetical protein